MHGPVRLLTTQRMAEQKTPRPPRPVRARSQWEEYANVFTGAGHTAHGDLRVLRGLASPQLGNRRDIVVYVPPGYRRGLRRYPVLYMHDGQNLFDAATAFAGEWGVDEVLERAAPAGLEAIVVGVPNAGADRLDEYSPFTDQQGRGGRGEAYALFLADTLKPLIDRDFRTMPERETTAVTGSSMGGLISLYSFFRRSDVFGMAGVMSPALWFADGAIFDYVRAAPRRPGRIYLDAGTREGAGTVADVRRMRDLLSRKGYASGKDLLLVVELGGRHTEAAWGRRLLREFEFLLGTG